MGQSISTIFNLLMKHGLQKRNHEYAWYFCDVNQLLDNIFGKYDSFCFLCTKFYVLMYMGLHLHVVKNVKIYNRMISKYNMTDNIFPFEATASKYSSIKHSNTWLLKVNICLWITPKMHYLKTSLNIIDCMWEVKSNQLH